MLVRAALSRREIGKNLRFFPRPFPFALALGYGGGTRLSVYRPESALEMGMRFVAPKGRPA